MHIRSHHPHTPDDSGAQTAAINGVQQALLRIGAELKLLIETEVNGVDLKVSRLLDHLDHVSGKVDAVTLALNSSQQQQQQRRRIRDAATAAAAAAAAVDSEQLEQPAAGEGRGHAEGTNGTNKKSIVVDAATATLDLELQVARMEEKLDRLLQHGKVPAAPPPPTQAAVPLIPKLIHQTWKTTEIPAGQQAAVQSWLTQNPGYTHTVHTDADMEVMMKEFYPEIIPAWNRMRPVEKVRPRAPDTFRTFPVL
jgi:hypothetical protein